MPADSNLIIALSSWLALASIKSLPIFAAILLVQRLLKRQLSPGARHGLWLSFYLCLCFPVGWNLPIPTPTFSQSYLLEATPAPSLLANSQPQRSNNPPLTPETSTDRELTDTPSINPDLEAINWRLTLGYLWLGVFAGFCLLTLRQMQRFKRIKESAPDASTNTQLLFARLKIDVARTRNIRLLQSASVQSPIALGLIKPVIVLPLGLEQQLSPEQLSHVLRHELAHIARRDILWNWLSYWITLLHWFNPLAWYANQRMKADMEMACDASALSKLPQQERTQYALTLIDLSQSLQTQHRLTPCVGILENHRELKSRLLMIKESNTMSTKSLFAFGLILSALTLSALAQPNGDTSINKSTKTNNSVATFTLMAFAQQAEKDLKTQIIVGQGYSTWAFSANTSNKPLDYGQFLSQLKVNGFTAFRSQGYIQIIPISEARNSAIPIVDPGKKYFDDEFVTEFLSLNKGCSSNYLPTLRPMIPREGHLALYENQKMMVITDTFANVQRIKAIITRMEAGLSQIDKCETKPEK